MNRAEAVTLAERFLSAWNSQDVERVLACYTEDCIYLDPNTRGPISGHEALRKYLSRLFQQWTMNWSLREFFPFDDQDGGAFLWRAKLTPATEGKTVEIDGMDLVIIRDNKLHRNEVYFDRALLYSEK